MFGLPPRVEIPQSHRAALSSLMSTLAQSASHPVAHIVCEDIAGRGISPWGTSFIPARWVFITLSSVVKVVPPPPVYSQPIQTLFHQFGLKDAVGDVVESLHKVKTSCSALITEPAINTESYEVCRVWFVQNRCMVAVSHHLFVLQASIGGFRGDFLHYLFRD